MSGDGNLPDGTAYKIPGHFMYEGLVMGRFTPRDHLEKVKTMEIYDDDVMVCTYPKSGTTLVLEIVWLVRHNADVDEANKISSWERIAFIEYRPSEDDDGLAHAKDTPRPRTLKSHLQRRLLPTGVKEKNIKQVTVLRNPKDILVSYYYFYKSTTTFGRFSGTWDEFFEMFMVDNLYWGNVFDHVLEWWNYRKDPNVLVLFYEDILREPSTEIERVANFLDQKLSVCDIDTIAKATSFKTMKDNPMTNALNLDDEIDSTISPFMRKGVVGDWKNHFTEDQNRRMDEVIKKRLEGVDIHYTFEL